MKVTVTQSSGNHFATGGPGRGPGGVNSAIRIRIEKVARMRVNGMRDVRIQELLGIQAPAFKYLINLPEYKDVEEQILLGHLTEIDKATAGQVNILHQQLREAVPSALRGLIEVANQRRDLRTALSAQLEILDREPDRIASKSSNRNGEIPIEGVRLPDGVIDIASRNGDSVITELANKKERVQ